MVCQAQSTCADEVNSLCKAPAHQTAAAHTAGNRTHRTPSAGEWPQKRGKSSLLPWAVLNQAICCFPSQGKLYCPGLLARELLWGCTMKASCMLGSALQRESLSPATWGLFIRGLPASRLTRHFRQAVRSRHHNRVDHPLHCAHRQSQNTRSNKSLESQSLCQLAVMAQGVHSFLKTQWQFSYV